MSPSRLPYVRQPGQMAGLVRLIQAALDSRCSASPALGCRLSTGGVWTCAQRPRALGKHQATPSLKDRTQDPPLADGSRSSIKPHAIGRAPAFRRLEHVWPAANRLFQIDCQTAQMISGLGPIWQRTREALTLAEAPISADTRWTSSVPSSIGFDPGGVRRSRVGGLPSPDEWLFTRLVATHMAVV